MSNPAPPTDIQKWLNEAPEGRSRHFELECYNLGLPTFTGPRWQATYTEATWSSIELIEAYARGWGCAATPEEAQQQAWDDFLLRGSQ